MVSLWLELNIQEYEWFYKRHKWQLQLYKRMCMSNIITRAITVD
jgi:hypothetical protein